LIAATVGRLQDGHETELDMHNGDIYRSVRRHVIADEWRHLYINITYLSPRLWPYRSSAWESRSSGWIPPSWAAHRSAADSCRQINTTHTYIYIYIYIYIGVVIGDESSRHCEDATYRGQVLDGHTIRRRMSRNKYLQHSRSVLIIRSRYGILWPPSESPTMISMLIEDSQQLRVTLWSFYKMHCYQQLQHACVQPPWCSSNRRNDLIG